jgi:hypothetical protein
MDEGRHEKLLPGRPCAILVRRSTLEDKVVVHMGGSDDPRRRVSHVSQSRKDILKADTRARWWVTAVLVEVREVSVPCVA